MPDQSWEHSVGLSNVLYDHDEGLRGDIEQIPTSEELAFKKDKGEAVDGQAKCGLIHSFRQDPDAPDPHLQFVLNDNVTGMDQMVDVYLDVGAFHRSVPSVVYETLSEMWPDVTERYSF